MNNLLPELYWAILILVAGIWTNVRSYKAGQREGWINRAKWENLRNPSRRHLK